MTAFIYFRLLTFLNIQKSIFSSVLLNVAIFPVNKQNKNNHNQNVANSINHIFTKSFCVCILGFKEQQTQAREQLAQCLYVFRNVRVININCSNFAKLIYCKDTATKVNLINFLIKERQYFISKPYISLFLLFSNFIVHQKTQRIIINILYGRQRQQQCVVVLFIT